MNLEIENKVAVVTGASKGIGREISIALAREGVHVALVARGESSLLAVANEIKEFGGSALIVAADATSDIQSKQAMDLIMNEWGGVDFLINNAGGVKKYGSFEECNQIDWTDTFNLNVMSCVNFTKASYPLLKQSKSGRIITISSIVGLQPGFYNPHYSIVKAATINLSKHFANIYAKDNILSNVICVGSVHTNSWVENVKNLAAKNNTSYDVAYKEFEESESGKIPLGRVGEPSDVAGLVLYLLSRHASWITGSCFHISGGKYSAMA